MALELLLYSRPGCHLCDEMQAELQKPGWSDHIMLTVVNIDNDPALRDAYSTSIPVLVRADNGECICQYQVDEAAIRACLPDT